MTKPLEPNGGNLYHPHRMMVDSGTFWRCAHGNTGYDGNTKFVGCDGCKVEILAEPVVVSPTGLLQSAIKMVDNDDPRAAAVALAFVEAMRDHEACGFVYKKDYDRYTAFFAEVATLTSRHDVLGDDAVVYPSKLGEALSKIDPEWWKSK